MRKKLFKIRPVLETDVLRAGGYLVFSYSYERKSFIMYTERYDHKMSGKTKIFIDGRAGTTGLRIYERLEMRDDISLII